MKFLHLSDLHIGKSVHNFLMINEQLNFFEQVFSIIKNTRPAAVLIAGDIYDRSVPGVEAVKIFDDFFSWLMNEKKFLHTKIFLHMKKFVRTKKFHTKKFSALRTFLIKSILVTVRARTSAMRSIYLFTKA